MNPRLRQRRSRQRGAVLVEAAVVFPAFILLFVGSLFLHHVVRAQQQAAMESRSAAWTMAVASCAGGGNGVASPDFTSKMPGAPGSDVSVQNDLGEASSAAEGTAAVSVGGGATVAIGDSFSQSVRSHDAVYCNNVTEPGSVGGVVGWLIKQIGGLI